MATLVKSPSKSPSPVPPTSPTNPPVTTTTSGGAGIGGGKQRQPLKTSLSVDAGKGKTSMTPSSPRATAAPTTVVTKVSMEGAAGSGTRPPHMPLSATASLSLSAAAAQSSVVRTAAPPTPLPRTKRLSKRKNGTTVPPDKIMVTTTTPRRNFSKINRKGSQVLLSELHRPCLQHSFITEVTDVQQMEQGLLHLLDDFHSGKLQAFGTDCSFQKMDSIREQQERLARLHFDMGSQQEAYGTLSEEGQAVAKDHLAKLMTQLHELSTAIEQLQSSTSNSGLHTEV